jgi:hypothetical protein
MNLSKNTICNCLTVIFLIVLLSAVSAPAEMHIHSNSDKIVILPYNKGDVESITYSKEVSKISAEYVTLRSHNYPDRAIRHRNFMGELTVIQSQLDIKDSTFKVVKGLADPSAISFESVNYPGRYLRHQYFQIKLHTNDGSKLFLEDATFRKVPGLADDSKYSFESFNFPNYYIRHKNFKLYLEQGSGDLFMKDTTFTMDSTAWKN